MKLLSEGFQGKAEEMFQDRGFSFAQAELNETTTLAALRSKAERAQPKPTEKNPLYAKFLKKEQPPMTPDQLADIEARREAAQRHQEVRTLPHVADSCMLQTSSAVKLQSGRDASNAGSTNGDGALYCHD